MEKREVTGGANGYPSPALGVFTYGFESYAEAEAYAEDNGGEVGLAEWKNGWFNCRYIGSIRQPLDIAQCLNSETHNVQMYFSRQEALEELFERMQDKQDDLDWLVSVLEYPAETYEKNFVAVLNGCNVEAYPKEALSFHYDVTTSCIGVYKSYAHMSDEEEEEEISQLCTPEEQEEAE